MCYRASREEKELDGLRVRRNIRRFQSESRNTDPSSSKSCEEYQEKLDDLRLKRGTRESRRKLRHEFRSRSRMGKSHFPGPSVTKAKQVTCYVPPTDRPPLSTISVSIVELSRRRPRSNDDGLVTQISELELSTRASSALPGLMKLAQETREQIYGYILPIHVKKMFQAKGCETEIPSPTVVCPCDGGFTSPVLPDHGGKDRTAIMRVNKQIHREAQAYLFRGCTIRIRVDETGYSFLEHVSGGPFLDSTRRLCGTMSGNTRGSILVPGHIPSDARILNYECRDRFTEWHRTFVSKFDFSLPKKLIISVEAPDYENAEGVLQIAESMMSLCEVLRRCPKIKEIEVEPQRPKCRYTSKDYYDYDPKHNTRGSFFVWQWEDHSSPASQPCRHHTCNRNRFRFEREALWAGKLSCVLLPNKPDLQIVGKPIHP